MVSAAISSSVLTLDGRKLAVASEIGPSAATSVANATAATIALTIPPGSFKYTSDGVWGIIQLSGLPAGLVVTNFYVSGGTVYIVLYNPTAGTISINANSVTAVALLRTF